MTQKPRSPEEHLATLKLIESFGGSVTDAAKAHGLNRNTLSSRYHAARQWQLDNGMKATTQKGIGEMTREELVEQLIEVKAAARAAASNTITDEYVKAKIIGLTRANIEPPGWTTNPSKAHGLTGVATLFASDWHWGEVVQPAQVNGVNEFNMAIARGRARRLIDKTIQLCFQHLAKPKYDGIVFALGGDMVSGTIHEELEITNEKPIMPIVVDLIGVLSWCIKTLADKFGHVFVPCVTGNHGRNHKKPRAKDRNFDNFDWLIYQMLAKQFEDDLRVTFQIPDGSDAYWAVYGHRYVMSHGDQFRGGDGMIGMLGPVTRGDMKKRARNAQIDMEYDTLMLGHWHQLHMGTRLIVNGSLKGYDEYAAQNNFGFEIPQQGLWINHPSEGISFRMEVHLEDRTPAIDGRNWVSVTR